MPLRRVEARDEAELQSVIAKHPEQIEPGYRPY